MAQLLKGKAVATALNENTQNRAKALTQSGIEPTLVIIRIGNKEADLSYERGATKRCTALGITVRTLLLDEKVDQQGLARHIQQLNEDSSVHGILLLRPLPKHIDEEFICDLILPSKDVDGASKLTLADLFAGKNEAFAPCTAQAVMEILKYYQISLTGKRVSVIGRSLVIGKPVAMLALKENATVTICHSKTENLAQITQASDIIIACLGKAEALGAAYFQPDQCVIDVGIHYSEEKQKLVGDVNSDQVEARVAALTPVPGGVGAVTTSVLAAHVVSAAERMNDHEN